MRVRIWFIGVMCEVTRILSNLTLDLDNMANKAHAYFFWLDEGGEDERT